MTDAHSLRVLDFPAIVACIQRLTETEPGRRAAADLGPHLSREQVDVELERTSELKEYLQTRGPLPLGGVEALGDLLARATGAGRTLSPEELLQVLSTLTTTRRLAELGAQIQQDFPALAAALAPLRPCLELERQLQACIDGRGNIRDTASPELARIRKEIDRRRQRLHRELEQILDSHKGLVRDRLITVRNGRLVIPLKREAANSFAGIVHDVSQSGATAFVEPIAAVDLNNRLSEARSRERQEEARILRELTTQVWRQQETLLANERQLGYLDCLQARARMSSLLRARPPEIAGSVAGGKAGIKLVGARHPILALQELICQDPQQVPAVLHPIVWGQAAKAGPAAKPVKVVPIDLRVGGDHKVVIISGANTGGKTVALKTLGLLGAMVQSGLHIPVAEGSQWPFLQRIYAEIGDEQDLHAHLSTFSARIKRLVAIMAAADGDSLVLLDEIGTGTDPAEGAALALAVLDELREKGSLVVVTTHFHLLKAYALVEKEVVNAAVEFDQASGRPTYRILYGYPGVSNALKIAADLAMPASVLARTGRYLDQNNRRAAALLQELEQLARSLAAERQKLQEQRASLAAQEASLREERQRLLGERTEVLLRARERAEQILAAAEKELKALVAQFQRRGPREQRRVRQGLQQVRETLTASIPIPAARPLAVLPRNAEGMPVRLLHGGGIGVVVKVKHRGRRAEVQLGGKRVEVDCSKLELLPADHRHPYGDDSGGIRVIRCEEGEAQERINLVGLRVEEAIPLLDKALDQAVLSGRNRLQVVHGHGSGRLRQAVHEFVSGHAVVKTFRPAASEAGGTGVTIVELK